MEFWTYRDEDALYAESQPPTLKILLENGDSLSITTIRREKSVEYHASIATDDGSASGTPVTLTSSAGYSRTLTPLLPDSTFEGFVLCRLMASESDDADRYPDE